MRGKKLLIGGAVLVLVLAVVGYFVVTPMVQTRAYKQTVNDKHSSLNDKLNKVSAVLDRDIFVKTEVEPTIQRNDIKAGQEAVKDAESTLENVAGDLTGFSALPLLDWNSKYKAAKELDADEEKYVENARAYLAEFKAVLTYFEKTIDVEQKLTDFQIALAEAEEAETPQEFADEVDAAIKEVEPVVAQAAAIQPPASLKEAHDYGSKASKELLALYKDMATAARAEDMDKLDELTEQEESKLDEYIKRIDELNADFIRKSNLRKLDDTLKELDRSIDRKSSRL
jgi:hypothetical protein